MSGTLALSVVVPTRNRREVLISRTLPAIFAQDLPPPQFEIIVVVDGSTDGTIEALRDNRSPCSLRILAQPHRGPSAARNRGIQAARGEVILFLDDDIVCGPGLLRSHGEAHAGAGPVVVYGPIALHPDSPPSMLRYAVEAWYEKYYGCLEAHKGLRWPQGDYLISNSSIPRATLVDCGGFDERLPAKEDYELGLRLWKMGVPFKFLPSAKAYEYYLKPSRYVLRHDGEGFGRAEVLISRKHPEYRSHSALAALGKPRGWRRLWRGLYVRLPIAPVGLLAPALGICDKLCRFPALRRAGHYLLGVGRGVVEVRAAAREAGSWKNLRREFARSLAVLCYHHVGPPVPGTLPTLTVSPERFERHVCWLARRGFQGIGPADWLRWLREGKGLPAQPVLLTFDDAYGDLAETALPVLRRHGFGAAVYVVTGLVGGTNAWDEARGSGTHRLMTAEQIRYWATQGIEFGAHSRTHADLTALTPGQLREEVEGSACDLESLLGERVTSFAYPYGFHAPTVVDCVREAFDLAFILSPQFAGINDLATDPHLLRRTMVQPSDTLMDIEFRARRGAAPLTSLRARLKVRTRLQRAARAMDARSKR